MDILSAITDPELGYTAFTVTRTTYTRSRAGTTSATTVFQASGCVHPGTPEMIQLLPEEERDKQFISIYTDYALITGIEEKANPVFTGADRVTWNSQNWRVVRVRDWGSFGYYQAYAVLMKEGE